MTLSTTLSRPARIGALCLAAAAPLFLLAHVVAALGWRHPPFSWATHNISDLDNVHCGVWDTTRPRYVCSPWHLLMNLHVLGALLILVLGNIGLPLAAFAPAGTVLGGFGPLTLVTGVVALAGSVLFLTQQSLGSGWARWSASPRFRSSSGPVASASSCSSGPTPRLVPLS